MKIKTRKNIDPERLLELALEYVKNCEEHTIEQATAKGSIVKVKSRKIPTFKYFTSFWLRQKDFNFYCRQHFHEVLKLDEHPLNDTLKKIEEMFKSYAVDVVANEGKGIFYAKNFLGMTDRQQIDTTQNINIMNIDPLAD
jgi:hypothetical protein